MEQKITKMKFFFKPKKRTFQNSIFSIINSNLIQIIFQYFNIDDFRIISTLSSRFQKEICSIFSVSKEDLPQFLMFYKFYSSLEKTYSAFSPFLNVILNINISGITTLDLIQRNKSNNLNPQICALIYFLNEKYANTKQNKYFISLESKEDYDIHLKVIPKLIKYKELKYYLSIKSSFKFSAEFTELFTLITISKIIGRQTKMIFENIQKEIINKQIECYHYSILFKNNELVSKTEEYFKKYPNHLKVAIPDSKYQNVNKKNLNSIEVLIDYPKIEISKALSRKIKKIKCDFPKSSNYIESFNDNFDFSEIVEFGGFEVVEDGYIQKVIALINKMPKLKKLSGFNIMEDLSNDYEFKNFFSSIKAPNLEKIHFFGNAVLPGKDEYTLLLNKFPKLRSIQEDYDFSSMYDKRLEIEDVFSRNAENELGESDLNSIKMLLNNHFNYQRDGRKFISFKLFFDLKLTTQIFKYLNKNKEDNILNLIYTIDFVVRDYTEKKEKIEGLKKMGYFIIKEENEGLIPLFVEGIQILSIKVEKNALFHKYIGFISKCNPHNIIFIEEINDNIIQKINNIKTLNIIFVKSKTSIDVIQKFTKDNSRNFICLLNQKIYEREEQF